MLRKLQGATRVDVVSNRLVLVAPSGSAASLRIAPGFGLAAALGAGGRLAIGDPSSVPAGKYAQAALTALGVWPTVAGRVVGADNVRTALNFVARAEAPLGIVAVLLVIVSGGLRVGLATWQRGEERTAKLEETLRELNTFSYSVAHDLRGPLRAMTGRIRTNPAPCRPL